MSTRLIDPRAAAAWTEFAAAGGAVADGDRFRTRLHRPGFPHLYPPPVLTTAAAAELTDLGTRLAALVVDIPRRFFADDLDAWLAYLGTGPADADLMRYAWEHPRLRRASTAFIRPDFVLTADGPRLVEINVSTPMGGMSTVDPYTAAARDSDFGAFLADRGLSLHSPSMSQVWLETFASLVDRPEPPLVFEAVANPADADSGRRFFVDMMRTAGYDIRCGVITELDVRPDGVYHQGERVSIVVTLYTWFETKRFVPPALTRALMEADTARVVDFIGSPATALFDNKANLELLTSRPEVLTREERALVETHIPRTFRLTSSTVERAVAERESLVCKPASAYGGRDILFGAAHSPDAWAELLAARLGDGEGHICQHRVRPAVIDLPGTTGREVCAGPLIFGGAPAGLFLRQSTPAEHSTINVSQGAEAAAGLTVLGQCPSRG